LNDGWTGETLGPLNDLARLAFSGGGVTGKRSAFARDSRSCQFNRPGKSLFGVIVRREGNDWNDARASPAETERSFSGNHAPEADLAMIALDPVLSEPHRRRKEAKRLQDELTQSAFQKAGKRGLGSSIDKR
jgi:hypothetical protein